jgi:Resolvase, N terminal domain
MPVLMQDIHWAYKKKHEYCKIIAAQSQDLTGGENSGTDLLIIDRVELEPKFRGHNLGLIMALRTVDYLSHGCSYVALRPFPLQFSPRMTDKTLKQMRYDLFTKDEPKAFKLLAIDVPCFLKVNSGIPFGCGWHRTPGGSWSAAAIRSSTLYLGTEESCWKQKGVHFVSISERIDTNSAVGVAIFSILAAIAQLERDLIASKNFKKLVAVLADEITQSWINYFVYHKKIVAKKIAGKLKWNHNTSK